MVNNAGDVDLNGSFNGAVGAFALNGNTTGFSNNAMGKRGAPPFAAARFTLPADGAVQTVTLR